ncbi:MAG: membrane protein [Hyphococcus sp.]|nr:MAG: membrane protein [Marinicaulis sp.]
MPAMQACASDDGPTDMQIAHIAYTAGQIDIRYAGIALEKSENQEIRNFAELMQRDHKAVNDAALELVGKLGATPEDNPTSQSLMAQADAKAAELEALSGAEFDRAYAENELAYHRFVNDTVENAFIPAADNAEFKALLGVALKTFQAHEAHAEMMVEAVK